MLTTTLEQLTANGACNRGYNKLRASLLEVVSKDFDVTTPFAMAYILESNGLLDAVWALRTQPVEVSLCFAKALAYLLAWNLDYNPDPPDPTKPRSNTLYSSVYEVYSGNPPLAMDTFSDRVFGTTDVLFGKNSEEQISLHSILVDLVGLNREDPSYLASYITGKLWDIVKDVTIFDEVITPFILEKINALYRSVVNDDWVIDPITNAATHSTLGETQ